MVIDHWADSGTVVHLWEGEDIVVAVVVGDNSCHILAVHLVAAVDTHLAELECHDKKQGKQLTVLDLVVAVGF
jgi:hypothetical protein